MELRGTTTKLLLASGNSWNELLLIASIIILQQTQGRRQRTLIPLIILITKALWLPVRTSTIPFLLLSIQRSARYRISWLLLLWLLLLTIQLRRKFNWRDGSIIGRLGVISIVGYLMEGYIWREVYGADTTVIFGLGGGTTTITERQWMLCIPSWLTCWSPLTCLLFDSSIKMKTA